MEKLKKNDKVKIINNENSIWKNKKGIVINHSDNIRFNNVFKEKDLDTTLVKVKVNFGDDENPKFIIQEFPRYCLEIDTESNNSDNDKSECLNEKLTLPEDYIKDYVYTETLDDIIPSWFFVDKLATIENIKSEKVLEDAKKLKYNIYRIIAPYFDKYVIAAPKCSKQTVYNDYADYLQGSVEVREI